MNIKILDSWLRDYLKTDASVQKIADVMSLTSVGIERIEKFKNDYIYDIEVTTNRPDLLSVVGLAREATTALNQFNIKAEFLPPTIKPIGKSETEKKVSIKIINDPKLVYRVCAVAMEVNIKPIPQQISDRLETSEIRSLNNIIDVTNYVMRTMGHPTHVFDLDRLNTNKLTIRESLKGEQIVTLDGKHFTLPGGDVVAENDKGEIIDLLGIMGLENSVVTNDTKRILFFIDNNDPMRMRKTSMKLALRSEAVQMNEKHIDSELAYDALLYGIQLYKDIADAKIISDVIDIYPKPYTPKVIDIDKKKISTVIGIKIENDTVKKILRDLGMSVKETKDLFNVSIPSWRARDIQIPEDIIEEVARIYGYHNVPTSLPPLKSDSTSKHSDQFFWEQKVKTAFKFWGFTEVYTYSMVSETIFEGNTDEAVSIQNALSEEWIYMRKTLVPSLLKVVLENPSRTDLKLFEIANVYHKQKNDLPLETVNLAGIIKSQTTSIFHVKGLFEQLAKELGIKELNLKSTGDGNVDIYIDLKKIGNFEILEEGLIDFECDFSILTKHATTKKTYTPIPKYPPIIEDMAFFMPDDVAVGEVMETIKSQSSLIKNVQLYDKYENSRTFRIIYQNESKNLTTEDIVPIREKIVKKLETKRVTLKR